MKMKKGTNNSQTKSQNPTTTQDDRFNGSTPDEGVLDWPTRLRRLTLRLEKFIMTCVDGFSKSHVAAVPVAIPAINKDRYDAHPGYEARLLRLSERLRAVMEDLIEVTNMSPDVDTPWSVAERGCCDLICQDADFIAEFISDFMMPAPELIQTEEETPDALLVSPYQMEWTNKLDAAAQAGLLANTTNSIN